MKKSTYEMLISNAKATLQLWEAHPELKLNDMTQAGFQKAVQRLQTVLDEFELAENQFGLKMTERDDVAREVGGLITRTRSAVRGFFGPDSREYAQLGCTRASDRKRPTRHSNENGAPEPAAK